MPASAPGQKQPQTAATTKTEEQAMTIALPNPAAAVDNEPAGLAGGYLVDRVLRDGPLGPVLLGRGTVSNRPVVVKLLVGQLAADPGVRGRFLRAAERTLRLSHPNVVRAFAAGDNRQPFVVMEHVEGQTLAERVAAGGRLSGADTLRLATHLAAGLAHAHANGVVHGGLDAETILMGDDGIARITDFGLAGHLIVGLPGATAAAAAGDAVPARPSCSPADDVYALGLVLRQAAGDDVLPGLTAVIDAAVAPEPSVRPSAVDVHHQMLTLTDPSGVWLAPAVATACP
jgi:serine/threonine-protein kinase